MWKCLGIGVCTKNYFVYLHFADSILSSDWSTVTILCSDWSTVSAKCEFSKCIVFSTYSIVVLSHILETIKTHDHGQTSPTCLVKGLRENHSDSEVCAMLSIFWESGPEIGTDEFCSPQWVSLFSDTSRSISEAECCVRVCLPLSLIALPIIAHFYLLSMPLFNS